MFNFEINFTIPYIYFFIVYVLVMAMILFFAAASLYHLLKYGFMSTLAVFMTGLLITGTLYILLVSYEALATVDWRQELTIGQAYDSLNPF